MEPTFLVKELRKLAEAHLSKSLQNFRSKTDQLTGRASGFLLYTTSENERGFNQKCAWLLKFCAHYYNGTPPSRNPASATA